MTARLPALSPRRAIVTSICAVLAALAGLANPVRAADRPVRQLPLFPARLLWTIPLNSELVAPPAFGDDRAFFPIDGDRLVAYDLAEGRRLWIVPAAVDSKPALGDDLLFTSDGATITARRQPDGSVRWSVPLTERLAAPLTVHGGWLVAGTVSGTVLAFRAADGDLLWRLHLPAPLHAPAAISGDQVYLPTADGFIVAAKVVTGERIWQRRLGDVPNEILAFEKRLYAGSNDNYFYCLDARSGDVRWRWPTGADTTGTPAVLDNRVYFVSLDNNLRALDAGSGAQEWIRPLPLRPIYGVVLADSALVVGGVGGGLHAFGATDGRPVADLSTGHGLAAPPGFVPRPSSPLPLLVVVTDSLEGTAVVTAYTGSAEPPTTTSLARVADLLPKVTPAMPEVPSSP